MASSFVDIANAALLMIGQNTIYTFDDGTPEANITKQRYQACANLVLRMHPWNCATGRVKLAQLTSAPAFGFNYQYALPADYLRVLGVSATGREDDFYLSPDFPYRVEKKTILTNVPQLYLRYIQIVADPTQLDVLCEEAITTYLAYNIAPRLKADASERAALFQQFKDILKTAKNADAQEERRTLVVDRFEKVRMQPYGGSYLGSKP